MSLGRLQRLLGILPLSVFLLLPGLLLRRRYRSLLFFGNVTLSLSLLQRLPFLPFSLFLLPSGRLLLLFSHSFLLLGGIAFPSGLSQRELRFLPLPPLSLFPHLASFQLLLLLATLRFVPLHPFVELH